MSDRLPTSTSRRSAGSSVVPLSAPSLTPFGSGGDGWRGDEQKGRHDPATHSPPSLVAFRRLVGRSLVPPSLPLAAFGASFRGEWRGEEAG